MDATDFAKAVEVPAKHGLLTTADDFRTFINQLDEIADAGNFDGWLLKLAHNSALPEFARGRLYELTVAAAKATNGGSNLALVWDVSTDVGKTDVDILLPGGVYYEAQISAAAFKSATEIRNKLLRLRASGATAINIAVPSFADIPQAFWDVVHNLVSHHGFPSQFVQPDVVPKVFP